VLRSSNANLPASDVVKHPLQAHTHPLHAQHHNHDHALQAHWWAISATINEDELLHRIQHLKAELGNKLFRLKGIVSSDRGTLLIELVPFETRVAISLHTETQPAEFGLTIISSQVPNLKNYSPI
jgi:G3E family GTPase